MSEELKRYTYLISWDESAQVFASHCLQLDLVSQGATEEQALTAIKEAAGLYLKHKPGRMKTREELLERLVQILETGSCSHTDALNALSWLLDAEAEGSAGQAWVDRLRSMPEPR